MEPITLSNIETKSKQEVFDFIVNHLLKQNEKSMNSNEECLYRVINEDGKLLKCAAGCLIDDSEYSSDMEHISWRTLIKRKKVPEAYHSLIQDLQFVHDNKNINTWNFYLNDIARKNNLIFNKSI